MSERITLFADILVPRALKGYFTYRVPFELNNFVTEGLRVVVPFSKNKFYTGLIRKIHQNPPAGFEAKYIDSIIDEIPMVTEKQFLLWEWMSDYYMCSVGEIMIASMPAGLRMGSDTFFYSNPEWKPADDIEISDKEFLLLEALQIKNRVSLDEISEITSLKNPQTLIKKMIGKEMIYAGEEMEQRVRPKMVDFIELSEGLKNEEELKRVIANFENKKKDESKLDLLLSFLKYSNHFSFDERQRKEVRKSDLLKLSGISNAVLKSLIKSGVFISEKRVVSRLPNYEGKETEAFALNDFQEIAKNKIYQAFSENKPVLLHGITSSGKTEVYIRLIEDTLQTHHQVLFLVPEIALTAQLVNRLKRVFGRKIGIYHSKYSENERVEVWNSLIRNGREEIAESSDNEISIVLGPRSALLLPFNKLGLIIVDEEHDSSYKQHDTAPRYNARDTSLMLARQFGANCILGSATPSLETYNNALLGKIALVEMHERHGGAQLPKIEIADMRLEKGIKGERKIFSRILIKAIEEALEKKEQVILFQNRRGFSPMQICEDCHWIPKCKNCDVSLNYHKGIHQLRCHYCGYSVVPYKQCLSCSSFDLRLLGFGTEKIEEDLGLIFPVSKISRMDLDSTRSKFSYKKIIEDFENREIDILVGTQMITKGLDFSNVNLVGVINAEILIGFPDFRAHERAFQLLSQVSGRAGRRGDQGRVIIQTSQPEHPIIAQVISHSYSSFFETAISERRKYHYPPFCRLIKIIIKDRDRESADHAAWYLSKKLKEKFGENLFGPQIPAIERINNFFQREILIKISHDKQWNMVRSWISEEISEAKKQSGLKQTRWIIDVDPN